MSKRVFNFGAGPCTLPLPVMEQVQKEFLDFQGLGASVIEISHRSSQFLELLEETHQSFRRLSGLTDAYKIIFVHGGAQMQFSAIPLNFMGVSPKQKALYVESGYFAKYAIEEAKKYGSVEVIASSAETGYDRLPALGSLDPEASYLHITGNNTIVGTQWPQFPATGQVPLVVDATSDILSRVVDFSKFGVVYAGLQKNLGPSGMAIVIIREDLLGKALPETPKLLNYELGVQNNSLTNTTNTFAIYVVHRVLRWMEEQGGVAAIEQTNRAKAKCLYDLLDQSNFYRSFAHEEHRSLMNVPFHLPSEELTALFLQESAAHGLYALKGHRIVGGARASIYNAMPLEGVLALRGFMEDFEQRRG